MLLELTPSFLCAIIAILSVSGLIAIKRKCENVDDLMWASQNREKLQQTARMLASTALIFTLGALFL